MAGNPRVRVLWFTKGLGPGGVERLLLELARTIDQSRFDCRAAYLLPAKNHLVGDLAASGVPSTCLGPSPDWPRRLRALLVAQKIDILHVHAPYPAVLARVVARSIGRARPAVLYTEHNSWDGYGRITRWTNAATYPLDDARLAVSQTALDSVPPRMRRMRAATEVLIHGVDLSAVRSHLSARDRMRAELGVDEKTVLVVTVANLRTHKDYPTLLQAARRVIDAGRPSAAAPAVRFVAVGQGPLEATIKAMAHDLRLGDGFRLLGYRTDVLDVLAAGDIFTLASIAEGHPVALMEALALGLPVVATRVGGIPEAVRDGVEGLLVPPASPADLAGAILSVAGDPQRRKAMAAAAADRSGLFDIRRSTARIEQLYEELVAGRPRPRPRRG